METKVVGCEGGKRYPLGSDDVNSVFQKERSKCQRAEVMCGIVFSLYSRI